MPVINPQSKVVAPVPQPAPTPTLPPKQQATAPTPTTTGGSIFSSPSVLLTGQAASASNPAYTVAPNANIIGAPTESPQAYYANFNAALTQGANRSEAAGIASQIQTGNPVKLAAVPESAKVVATPSEANAQYDNGEAITYYNIDSNDLVKELLNRNEIAKQEQQDLAAVNPGIQGAVETLPIGKILINGQQQKVSSSSVFAQPKTQVQQNPILSTQELYQLQKALSGQNSSSLYKPYQGSSTLAQLFQKQPIQLANASNSSGAPISTLSATNKIPFGGSYLSSIPLLRGGAQNILPNLEEDINIALNKPGAYGLSIAQKLNAGLELTPVEQDTATSAITSLATGFGLTTLLTNPSGFVQGLENLPSEAASNPVGTYASLLGSLAVAQGIGGLINPETSPITLQNVQPATTSDIINLANEEDISQSELQLSNPAAKTLSLRVPFSEEQIPLLSKVYNPVGDIPNYQLGAANLGSAESVTTAEALKNVNNAAPISEGNLAQVQATLKTLQNDLGDDAPQVKYLQAGLNLAKGLKDYSLPALNDLQLAGLSEDEMSIIKDGIANAQAAGEDPSITARLYGTGSTQTQLGELFRQPHDLDIQLQTDIPDAKNTFAENLGNALNANGEHDFIVDGNKILLGAEKIIEVKDANPLPEDIEGSMQEKGGLKLGYQGVRGNVYTPQGITEASLGETLLGKLSSALAPREFIDAETGEPITELSSALKRGEGGTPAEVLTAQENDEAGTLGSKDVADSIAITQRILEDNPGLAAKLQDDLDTFKQIALERGYVTQAKIDESLNLLDTQGVSVQVPTVPQLSAISEEVSPFIAGSSAQSAINPSSLLSSELSSNLASASPISDISSPSVNASTRSPPVSLLNSPSLSATNSVGSPYPASPYPSPYTTSTSSVPSIPSVTPSSPIVSSSPVFSPSVSPYSVVSPTSVSPSLSPSAYPYPSPYPYSPYPKKLLGLPAPTNTNAPIKINPGILSLGSTSNYKPSLYSLLFPLESLGYNIPKINTTQRGLAVRPFSSPNVAKEYYELGLGRPLTRQAERLFATA